MVKYGGKKTIGIVFIIVFVLFLIISLAGIGPLPGDWITQEYLPDILKTDYATLAEGP